jgi:biopolymer transport protein ExbB/TolQ
LHRFELNWKKSDIENKFLFKSKKYTRVNNLFSVILAVIFTLVFYAILYPFYLKENFHLVNMFFHGGPEHRSIIPYIIVFLSSWCLAILFIKNKKITIQKKALDLNIVPNDSNFVLAPATVPEILQVMYHKVDAPKQFILLNRIDRAISNLKNIGRVGDVAEGLRVQSDNDEIFMESTYNLLRGFIWAIPVLGFIGTVLGLSQAVGGFGNVVAKGADIEKLKESLGAVTSGLAIAFETTLIALVAALIIQLIMSFVKQKEEDFLDECSDYCHENIISKLKMIDIRDEFNREQYD